ncbi:MAG: pilus assembly protein PilP [Nitrospirae bacterium]|nr:pilus assembly protein PilP [Nitrospirota bacterium]
MLGIMSGKHGYRALIQLGDGHGAIVGIGTRIGPDQGRVKKITDQAVVIEISSEREGTGVPFQRVLRLHSGE